MPWQKEYLMDVWRITVAALRRWYILVPLLALTAAAAFLAGKGVRPEYVVTGTAMVVPGRTVSQTPNPYGNVDDANTVLGVVLNSPETRAQLAANGLNPNYEVTPETRSTITNFSVRVDKPEAGIDTGRAVFQHAEDELSSRQNSAGIPKSAQYGIVVLQAPSLSAAVTTGKMRIMAIIGVLGAGISLLVAVLFDDILGLVRRRSARKTRPSEVSSGDPQSDLDAAADDEQHIQTTDANEAQQTVSDGHPDLAEESLGSAIPADAGAGDDEVQNTAAEDGESVDDEQHGLVPGSPRSQTVR